ncbi:MAG TPA: pitrilysin family protein [Vicinamibacterales bacterium]|nr:pitrilysin family protein [Vicinamibacterales bacterium]
MTRRTAGGGWDFPVRRSLIEGGSPATMLLLFALLAVPSAALAQSPRPAVGPERPFTPPPRVERTLSNGLRVVAVRFPTVPKVSIVLTIQSGLAVDPADKAGLAQFVADAVQEGTTSRDSETIRREIFSMGASLNAAAGQDTSSFTIRGLADTMPAMTILLSDIVRNPTFPQQEIDLLKANTAQRLQAQLASPQYVANRSFRQTLFGSHPYARTGPTLESVKIIDRASIVEYHKTYYRPNNAFVVVTGDVMPEAAFAAVEKAFDGWARGAVPPPPAPPVPALEGRRVVFVQRPNSVQSSISVGNFTIRRSDPRWIVMNVANQIYGGAFDSRLIRNIREDKGYTYSPQSVFQAMGQAGLYRAVADVRNEVTGATLKEIYSEIDKLRADGPSEQELDNTKMYARGLFVIQNATQNGFANTLNTMYSFGLPKDYPETFQKTVSSLSTEAVKTGAQMLLGSQDSVIVVVGDYTKVKDQLTGFENVSFVDINGNPIKAPR